MFKDILKDEQPIVYRTLVNALNYQHVGHAYIFCGRNDQMMLDTALFLAQSIICNENIACETCDTCQRIKNFNYGDLLYLDGRVNTIKKEDITSLQQQFSKTALEPNGNKIYIINHVENASDGALNSLLKFLEEPSSNNIYAIFITNNLYQVLPTIVSRCETIQFRPDDTNKVFNNLKNQGIDEIDSYFLSVLCKDASYQEMEEYQLAYVSLERFIKDFPNKLDDFLLYYQLEILVKDKDLDLKVTINFFDLVANFIKDITIGKNDIGSWYGKKINELNINFSLAKCLLITLQQKDKCNKTNNLRLIVDEFIYKLQEVTNE